MKKILQMVNSILIIIFFQNFLFANEKGVNRPMITLQINNYNGDFEAVLTVHNDLEKDLYFPAYAVNICTKQGVMRYDCFSIWNDNLTRAQYFGRESKFTSKTENEFCLVKGSSIEIKIQHLQNFYDIKHLDEFFIQYAGPLGVSNRIKISSKSLKCEKSQ